VLQLIKANETTRDIPVIVITASSRDRDVAECRRLGADNYVVKPVGDSKFGRSDGSSKSGLDTGKAEGEHIRSSLTEELKHPV